MNQHWKKQLPDELYVQVIIVSKLHVKWLDTETSWVKHSTEAPNDSAE